MLKFLGCVTIPVALLMFIPLAVGAGSIVDKQDRWISAAIAYGWVPVMILLGIACFFVENLRVPTVALFVLGLVAFAIFINK